MSAPLIVAIDGPSGVGKSTVARVVAEYLGVPYLETGAMYRTLGLEVLERSVDPEDREAVETLAEELDLRVAAGDGGSFEIRLSGRPVGDRIYTLEVADATSKTSVYPGVRRRMRSIQRRCAREHGGVLEGRDIGTRVVPETPHKFFLTASPEVRAERRWLQLQDAGDDIELAAVEREVRERDYRDSNRKDSPLRWDDSYRVIDTGELSAHQVIETIVAHVRGADRRAGGPAGAGGGCSSEEE